MSDLITCTNLKMKFFLLTIMLIKVVVFRHWYRFHLNERDSNLLTNFKKCWTCEKDDVRIYDIKR